MATRKGLVKKTPLDAYSRPKRGGIIAIKLREDDELVDVVVTKPDDEIVLATATGMAIRFKESDARSMGRNTSGVKGIALAKSDELVGMVVVVPEATLLTVCENGYGKRTPFGMGEVGEDDADTSSARYRTQRRGGKGLRDIRATKRNGKVVAIAQVVDGDELLMMTSRGKIQRMRAAEISVIGRNTQGVRIMSLDDTDSVAAVVRVPLDEAEQVDVELDADSPDDADDSTDAAGSIKQADSAADSESANDDDLADEDDQESDDRETDD